MIKVKKRQELIKAYLDFFKSKNHKIIPSSSLIPENDPTVLFTTAGMHPLVPFLLGQSHPLGRRLANVQKCIRTQDIDEVGDNTHHTFFEMLGNWSFGDYFKKDAIKYSFEFLTKILNIQKEKLAISVFAGDKNAVKDQESAEIWISLGIKKEKIAYLGKENNWWGPAGATGPCGPDTEMFYYAGKKNPKIFNAKDKNWVEIWNDVFMQYNKNEKNQYYELKQKNVDTGMGVERTLAVLQGLDDNYLIDCFIPIIKKIEEISKKSYKEEKNKTAMRIIADHIKASVFIIADGVIPSNIERGYVLRRLIRRAIRYGKQLGIEKPFIHELINPIIKIYPDYQELKKNKEFIIEELKKEEGKFNKTLYIGLKKFNEFGKNKKISGKEAFLLFQSFGFPVEMTKELCKEKNIKIDLEEYEKEYQ